ncbi:YhcH/YjgK/YiaL family protein [Rubellicoccus peritrichatus]|uniref:YhcH/YjgK/YiaL family protein n=1 Tax=Rubellicoccus peritrichatus TaxID=3080537 RepID=A0AAQ3QXM4_9BACT|nr:YhcH/YjgK/YiaL family protein [Puniceicoccus sp. CR14]WOO43005.1 YhcH/YjgK/YiaL family protein [Puniceicoccus sp. CR14]
MIFDHLDKADAYALGAPWQKAFEFLRTLGPDSEEGEFQLDGDRLFAKVMSYETRTPEEGNVEAHRQYADIQVCLHEAEGIDLFYTDHLKPRTDYDSEKDLIFFQPEAQLIGRVDMHPGFFCVLYPQDAHRPQMIVGSGKKLIKKAVVKVAL